MINIFYPIQSRNKVVDSFQLFSIDETEPNKLKKSFGSYMCPTKLNLNKVEYLALQAPYTIIRHCYKSEALRQLNDVNTYQLLGSDPTGTIQLKLSQILDDGRDMEAINQKTVAFLTVDQPVIPIFHHLPKVHKQQSLSRAIRLWQA